MKVYGEILLIILSASFVLGVSQSIQIWSPLAPVADSKLNMFEAVETGRQFLDGNGLKTGKILSISHEVRVPNYNFDEFIKATIPRDAEARLLWVIRFEQAIHPGHYFEVWVDESREILGGAVCL